MELTDERKSSLINIIPSKDNKSSKKGNFKLKLEDDFLEKLFSEEMEFKMNPNKEAIPNIINKYCEIVEYYSSKDDEINAQKYKLLIDVFLNNPTVVNLLDNKEINEENDVVNNNLLRKLIISNKKKHIDISDEIDDINFNFGKSKNFSRINEKEIYNRIININRYKNANTEDIINKEIKDQQSNFQRKLTLKKVNTLHKRSNSSNENKIIQSIQNTYIDKKIKKYEKNDQLSDNKMNNLKSIEKQISPILLTQNSNNEDNLSITDNKSNYNISGNNPISNISINDFNENNISKFEPLTPGDINKFEISDEKNQSKNRNNKITIIDEINETNDFSMNNLNDGKDEIDEIKELEDINEINLNYEIQKDNKLNSYETKDISSVNIKNSSLFSKKLSDSEDKNYIFKNFRLDFKDLFECIKTKKIISKKQRDFCEDIKKVIEKYINDYNQNLNDNIFIKFIRQISNLWDEMFNKYVNISDMYDRELKKVDEELSNLSQDDPKFEELKNLYENINIEKENEINRCEDLFSSKIESISVDFKNNYNNNDEGTLLMNEKFALSMSQKIFDMIRNISN